MRSKETSVYAFLKLELVVDIFYRVGEDYQRILLAMPSLWSESATKSALTTSFCVWGFLWTLKSIFNAAKSHARIIASFLKILKVVFCITTRVINSHPNVLYIFPICIPSFFRLYGHQHRLKICKNVLQNNFLLLYFRANLLISTSSRVNIKMRISFKTLSEISFEITFCPGLTAVPITTSWHGVKFTRDLVPATVLLCIPVERLKPGLAHRRPIFDNIVMITLIA